MMGIKIKLSPLITTPPPMAGGPVEKTNVFHFFVKESEKILPKIGYRNFTLVLYLKP